MVIRVNDAELEFPAGYMRSEFVIGGLFALFNCCTFDCCLAGWQLVPRSEFDEDLGFDTVYCPCHGGQYDPTRVSRFRHPEPPMASGASYVGIQNVAGPPNRGLPLIPVDVIEDTIVGKPTYPDWYRYGDFVEGFP